MGGGSSTGSSAGCSNGSAARSGSVAVCSNDSAQASGDGSLRRAGVGGASGGGGGRGGGGGDRGGDRGGDGGRAVAPDDRTGGLDAKSSAAVRNTSSSDLGGG